MNKNSKQIGWGRRKCLEEWNSGVLEIFFAVTLDVVLFGVPLVVMSAAYTLIALELFRSVQFVAGGMPFQAY